MRKGVLTWWAKAEQEISCKDRFFQKNELVSATITAGAVNAAAIKAVHLDKNFRRVDTKAILPITYHQIARPRSIDFAIYFGNMQGNVFATTLRPEGPADVPFLLEVYAGTRQEELAATGWPAEMRDAFVRMQFNAQRQGYRAAFPRADFAIILLGGEAVGRMVVDRAEDGFLLIDIALLPAHRGRGLGTALVENLLREAAAARKPVRLSVVKGQRAFQLYQRLGFVKTGEDSLREQMEWRGHLKA